MTTLQKEEVKEAIREVIREDKAYFKSLLQELLEEPSRESQTTDLRSERDKKVDAIIQHDFDRYKNVFKALA